ncbi:hypothetical protein HWV62_40092 [Athelia sp. TMB]|nr:hypothetical protein HWV62_40092 [Athelia sp. TMB]
MTRPDVGTADAKIEVEMKVGILRDRVSGARLKLPVLVETILAPDSMDIRFESNMSKSTHKHYNELLNKLKLSSSQPGHPSTPLEYAHRYLSDSFYGSDARGGDKTRLTRDEKSGEVVECVRKVRLSDLNIYSPKRGADWRVSVNLEVPMPQPLGSPLFTRRKDRISYTHEEFSIDLTQVTSTANSGAAELLHELEIEISRPALLLATALKRGDPNASELERGAFDELIRAFVNNARILVRNAGDGWQQ